ncbi:AraC family transcriptional regulator [Glaciimonas sp. GG7]
MKQMEHLLAANTDSQTMQQFDHWARDVCQSLNPVTIDCKDREHFSAHSRVFNLGKAKCLISEGSDSLLLWRTNRMISHSKTQAFNFLMMRSGSGTIRQGAKKSSFKVNDIVLIDTRQDLTCAMDNMNFVIISIPEAMLRTRIPLPEDYVARTLSGDDGWCQVLTNYIHNLTPTLIDKGNLGQQALMLEHIMSMYVFALEEQHLNPRQDHKKTPQQDLFSRMSNWLQQHYMRPDMCATRVSQHFNISLREVHRQFSQASNRCTFLESLRAIRMTAAIRMLKDPHFSKLNIAEIGRRCGFDDPAYFSKIFRKIIGATPSVFAKNYQTPDAKKECALPLYQDSRRLS